MNSPELWGAPFPTSSVVCQVYAFAYFFPTPQSGDSKRSQVKHEF